MRQLTSSNGISGPSLVSSPPGPYHLAALLAGIAPALAAGGTFVDTNWCNSSDASGAAGNSSLGGINPCPPRLSSNPVILKIVIVVVVVQVVIVVVAAVQWFKKPSGISADPTTIAGVASVMGHPDVELLFASLPTDISRSELRERLRGRRFRLGTFATAEGVPKYGIIPANDAAERKEGLMERFGHGFNNLKDRLSPGRSWKTGRVCADAAFGLVLLALFSFTAVAVSHVDQPQTVFPASGTAMRVFFTVLGMVISNYWGRLFQGTL